MTAASCASPFGRLFDRLRSDSRAVSMVEFALCLPMFMMAVLWSIELTNYALVRQQVSQLALQIADNASRIGTVNAGGVKQVGEDQVNDLFTGANLQGASVNLAQNGRVIVSSLEVNPNGGQWIHWQRCSGTLTHASSYGVQGDGATGTSVTGMGPASARVKAIANATPLPPNATTAVAVMFVEVGYRYKPIISSKWAPPLDMTEIATMTVRDSRDLDGQNHTGLYTNGATPSTC